MTILALGSGNVLKLESAWFLLHNASYSCLNLINVVFLVT